MSDHLPKKLIIQILLRLPTNSLRNCRSVCKSWLSLISSTHFRHLYLRTNFPRNLVRRVSLTENMEISTVHFNDQHFTQDTRVSIQSPLNLVHLRTIGCCNGVICLSDDNSEGDETVLWNPSIGRKLTLIPPLFRNSDSEDLILIFGFGFDKMTDDYKVVRLAYNSASITNILPHPHVEIYTVKTDIWRVIEFPHNFPSRILPHWINAQVYLNGSAHWLASTSLIARHSSILTFDMSTERFGEIQLPESLANDFPLKLNLVVVEECLGVIYSSDPVSNTSSSYEIWAMKEYKTPATWTMIYNMQYPDKAAGRALGLTNNGDLITWVQEGLTIHNKEGCYNVFGFGSEGIVWDLIFVERYQESLGLLDVGNDVGNDGQVQELDDE